jgi:arylformamidase
MDGRTASPRPGVAADLAAAFARSRLVDLSHCLEEGIPTYPTHARYFRNDWTAMGDIAKMHQLVLGDHTGTHVDSPCHFPVSGPHATVSVDQLRPDALTGRCVTISLDPPPAPNDMVSARALTEWEEQHEAIRAGDIVLLDFQWGRSRWGRGEAGFAYLQNWPGIGRDAAELLRDRNVRAVGTDCVSLDSGDGGRGELPAHFTLLTAGVLIIENLANLQELPPVSFFLAFPLRISGGTGSPLRALAAVDAPPLSAPQQS